MKEYNIKVTKTIQEQQFEPWTIEVSTTVCIEDSKGDHKEDYKEVSVELDYLTKYVDYKIKKRREQVNV